MIFTTIWVPAIQML